MSTTATDSWAKLSGYELLILVACSIVALCALLANVSAEGLDHGYTRYGAIAEKMVRHGDFIVPWLGDEIYILKPPLQSWLIAIPISLLGDVPNWATHFPNLLGAAASLIATWFLARRILGSARLATLSALVFATTWTFVEHSRGERVDPLFADSLVTALTFFHAAVHDDRRRTKNRLVFGAWLSLSVAILTKGHVGLIFFLAVAIPYSIVAKRGRLLLSPPSLVALASAISFSLIWPILLVQRIGIETAKQLLTEAEFAQRVRGLGFYIQAIPHSMLPWAVFLPCLIWHHFRKKSFRVESPLCFPILWIISLLVVLHVFPAKAGRYLLPLLAPSSILIAALFASATGRTWTLTRGLGVTVSALIAAVALASPFAPASIDGIPFGVPLRLVPLTTIVLALALIAGTCFLRSATSLARASAPLALALAFLLAFSVHDLLRYAKLKTMDGRSEALEVLEPRLRTHTIHVADLTPPEQGMIESIVRADLPRLGTAEPGGATFVIAKEDGAAAAGLMAAGARNMGSFELDETDYLLIQLPVRARG